MNTRLADFLAARAAETYPEPRMAGHTDLTARMAERVAKLLPAGARVIDVGCGQGPALEWFKAHGFDALGISSNVKETAQLNARGFHVLLRDMHEIGLPATCYDCVWARHVLEHSVIPFFVLHEFARALKPGGILYVEVPGPDTDSHHETNANHYSVMGDRMWASLIARAGFAIVDAQEIRLKTPLGRDVYFSFTARKL